MFNRSLAVAFIFVFIFNVVGVGTANAFAPNRIANANRAKAAQLVSQLPESDAVFTADVKKMFESGLPTMLAGNATLLSSILGQIDELKNGTGIDITAFDLLVAGISSVKVKEGEFDFHPVMIARGNVDSSQIIVGAKKAANNKYKEETIGNRSFLIFKTEELAQEVIKQAPDKEAGLAEKAVSKISGEIALTALDSGTIAFGEISRVRQMVEGRSKISAGLVTLLNSKPFGMANIAATVPNGMSAILPLDDDDLGNNIDSIKQFAGYMDVTTGGAKFNISLKTAQNAQAQALYETVSGMRSIGAAILGGSERDDQKLYAKVINYLKVSRSGTEVTFDLTLPQTDMNALSALIKF